MSCRATPQRSAAVSESLIRRQAIAAQVQRTSHNSCVKLCRLITWFTGSCEGVAPSVCWNYDEIVIIGWWVCSREWRSAETASIKLDSQGTVCKCWCYQSINQSFITPEGSKVKTIIKLTYKLIWKVKTKLKNCKKQIQKLISSVSFLVCGVDKMFPHAFL